MKIHCFVVGPLSVNCYILENKETKEAVVIDPGGDSPMLMDYITSQELRVKGILLTHGHFDHIGAVKVIKESFDIPVYIHEEDKVYLENPSLNLSKSFGNSEIKLSYDYTIKDKEKIELAGFTFEVIHTPGHTPGGVCYRVEDILFTGDTLFRGTIGRSDFPGGNAQTLFSSIRKKLEPLKEELIVYPGHGDQSTIGEEKKFNPAMQNNLWD